MVVVNKEVAEKHQQKKTKRPKCLVFFCGGGLTSGAFIDEEYDVIGGIDYDDHAEEVYKLNFPKCIFLNATIRELTVEKICEAFGIEPGDIDVIQISAPCPGISSMGDGVQLAAINELTIVATALAFALKPKVVLYEQVKNLTRKDMSVLFGIIWSFLKRSAPNYNMDAMVLNSWLYGDPQTRERLFLMCVRQDVGEPMWPDAVPVDQRRLIRDVLPDAEYMVNNNYGKRSYFPDQPAPTVIGGPDFTMFNGFEEVELQPRDYARFMGVPDWFQLVGPVTSQKLVIGNGVPWNVTRSLAIVIRDYVLDGDEPDGPKPDTTVLLLPAPVINS